MTFIIKQQKPSSFIHQLLLLQFISNNPPVLHAIILHNRTIKPSTLTEILINPSGSE